MVKLIDKHHPGAIEAKTKEILPGGVHLSPTANHREALLSPGVLIIAHPSLLKNHRHSKTEVPVFSFLCPSSNPAAEPFSQN